MGYFSKNRYKYYSKCHLIFVCKYRKQLITDEVMEYILNVFKSIEEQSDFDIEVMETIPYSAYQTILERIYVL